MKELLADVKWFLQQKFYVIALSITAACSYGFAITHHSIGIDDTAVELYLVDGLEVVMGRWTVFLLNKLFHVAEFAPFVLELVGVLLFMLAVTLFCVLLRRILGERVDILGYTIFACIFLSNPITSEVYIYYYHDGVDFGFCLTALALLTFLDGLNYKGRKKAICCLKSMLCIWVAVGCYESLLILYIIGLLIILFLRGLVGRDQLSASYVIGNLAIGALLTVGSVVLRAIIIEVLVAVFGLSDAALLEQRSLSEMLVLFRGREGLADLIMLAKRFWLVYHVNAVVYLPVAGYEFACFCVGIYSCVYAVKKKNVWYPIVFVGMLIAPFLLTIAEARLTYYRSCQYIPFFTALGAVLLYMLFYQQKGKNEGKKWLYIGRIIVAALAIILVYNQSAYMNQCFYVDYQKYEHAKEILLQTAYEVEKKYGTGMPVFFTGDYEVPAEIAKKFCVEYDSWEYRYISAITNPVDEHLKEKYMTPYGYSFAGEAYWNVIDWGLNAFDGTNRELIHFLYMHGHSFQTITDKETIEAAIELGNNVPRWPKEGAISEQDGYILVNF